MISCQHAKQLFDRYLDGELSSSLQTELHAHQLACTHCQGELAIFEACGDVIALDHPEPVVSASFTDQVITAYRAQKTAVRQRVSSRARLMRLSLFVGSPLAAAASIVLAVILIAPSVKPKAPSMVAGERAAVERQAVDILTAQTGRELSAGEIADLQRMEKIESVGFMNSLLDSLAQRTGTPLSEARQSVDHLRALPHLVLNSANEVMLDEAQSPVFRDNSASERVIEDWNYLNLPSLNPHPGQEATPGGDAESDVALETL